MKLRTRITLFSATQLAIVGVLLIAAYVAFWLAVFPMVEGLLESKTDRVSRALAADLDIGLGARDRKMIEASVATIVGDPDVSYIGVRDVAGTTIFEHGAAPNGAFAGPPNFLHLHAGALVTWHPVALEGLTLGSVAVATSTARLDALATWTKRIVAFAFVVWMFAFVYALRFARSVVVPIAAMTRFTHAVARGAFDERLDIAAIGELGRLRDDLNEMTRDLHDRRAAAETMQRELVDMSRVAGMAEVATGVLHNVGNVLNSLNVSVTLIDDKLRESRVKALAKSIELATSHAGGLAAFLATPKGGMLPDYLAAVASHLGEENAAMRAEIASVVRNIDHIKAIVAHQQAHARPTGVTELVDAGDLVETALAMAEGSFSDRGITVVREFAPNAELRVDRHRLLQILINLISNARHALSSTAPGLPRVLSASVSVAPSAVTIVIADSGVGIAAENLTKIFQHGFTTKPGGHGFGLHACAIAARELGGTIAVASDGPGQGARFTIELPTNRERASCRVLAIAS